MNTKTIPNNSDIEMQGLVNTNSNNRNALQSQIYQQQQQMQQYQKHNIIQQQQRLQSTVNHKKRSLSEMEGFIESISSTQPQKKQKTGLQTSHIKKKKKIKI